MADAGELPVGKTSPIHITLQRSRYLRGQRGDAVNSQIRVEFGDRILAESAKVEGTAEEPPEYNCQTSITINYDDPHSIDEVANKPVVCTFIEILPKEKKQKEEKTVQLGQCTIDLLPLLLGETKIHTTLIISPSQGSPMENMPADGHKGELDVEVFVEEPLFTEAQRKEINLMSVTVESLYSPPDGFTLTGPQFNYTAALPIPVNGDKEMPIVFAAGHLKPGVDKEHPNKQKKWSSPGAAMANAIFIPNTFLSTDISTEEENGDFKGKEDSDHRHQAEMDKNRITWNIERRCYLDSLAAKCMQEKIAKTRWWPVEIVRTPLANAAKGKGKEGDDSTISYHGVVYLNLAPLLYPGIKRIKGAFKVLPFSENELHAKCDRKASLAEEAVRLANGIINRTSNTPYPKGGKKEDSSKKDKKPAKGGTEKDKEKDKEGSNKPLLQAPGKPPIEGSETGQSEPVNVEGQQYADSRAYLMVEINLSRPLVPRRPPEELAKKVAEYIPPRPMFPKRKDGAQKSVEEYHNQVSLVSEMVLDEFRDLFGDKMTSGAMPNTPNAMEDRKQELMFHLNSTGKYFAMKEQLKHSVVKIVREKYLKTSSFKDRDELQHFLSELYVFLVDEMHKGLNNTLQIEDQAPIPPPITDSSQLKHFAREAEVNGNYPLAAKYYQERIARDNKDPDHWMDYGIFCMYISDFTKAEECFKECVSLDQRHQQGLILSGIVSNMQDKNDAAETFFEAATSFEPQNITAWTMLGLFYDGIGNDIRAEMALNEANKLNIAAAQALAAKNQPDPLTDGRFLNQPQPPEEAPPQKTAAGRAYHRRHSIESSKKDHNKTGNSLNKSNQPPEHEDPEAAALAAAAKEITEAVPAETIYMQTASMLLDVKALPFAERALGKHLIEQLGGQSCQYYIAMARLSLLKGDLESAEFALKEAMQFDYNNSDVWALSGHVKYLVGNTQGAKECYERTTAFVADASEMHSIYLRLASIYLQEGQFEKAKKNFLISCKRSPSCLSWLGVGIASYRKNELSEAEDALAEANILNNTDPEVWAYLALVCLKTNRQLEAEQAYKYAMKLRLEDEQLIEEIKKLQDGVGFGDPQY